ncbi:MAG: NlpC/P60 family protein [Syntrophorhabdus sp. PtaU1.Bin153]|nr:MAG: NlpC/P60 family protein [Syntrophorhabdus sp. PtaU1.Bin153]
MKPNINERLKKYRGIKFKYGGYGPDNKGLDCLGFVYTFLTENGVTMPDALGEINKENYSQFYRENEDKADQALLDYFDTFGTEISPKAIIAGDVILVRHNKTGRLFPAIYGGNGIAVSSFIGRDVRSFAVGGDLPVVKARRVF